MTKTGEIKVVEITQQQIETTRNIRIMPSVISDNLRLAI